MGDDPWNAFEALSISWEAARPAAPTGRPITSDFDLFILLLYFHSNARRDFFPASQGRTTWGIQGGNRWPQVARIAGGHPWSARQAVLGVAARRVKKSRAWLALVIL
jgi:hypothetical protein